MNPKKIVLQFGVLALVLALLLIVSRYSLFVQGQPGSWLIALFAALFVAVGLGLARLQRNRVRQAPPEASQIAPVSPEVFGISKREYEVLELVAQGLSNQEIAERLFISESTVKTHVSSLLAKLDARRRTHAVTLARQKGLLPVIAAPDLLRKSDFPDSD